MKVGKPRDVEGAKNGTKLSRAANFRCLMSDTPMSGDHVKSESKAGRMGARFMAIVVEGERRRAYLASRQTIPMSWDFCELYTLLEGTGSYDGAAKWTAESIEGVAAE